jgi:hypothetical protein
MSELPRVRRKLDRDERGTGGSDSARYCYSVWLRHLVKAHANGLDCAPKVVAELGPGDSLGMGCAALLSGAERYYALEAIAHDNLQRNLSVLDGLIELFTERAAIPDEKEFPHARPKLHGYAFPESALPPAVLSRSLAKDRIERIKHSIRHPNTPDSMIQYSVPWSSSEVIARESVDMILSQAVLEHVDDLAGAYRAMRMWLKTNAFMSHEIDFKSHGTARTWDGHWAYSDLMWKIIRGKRSWLINREPCCTHMSLIEREGFTVVHAERGESDSTMPRSSVADRFKNMPESDRTTSELFIQAVKV